MITNDYAAPNPLKKGHPEGHVDGPAAHERAGVRRRPDRAVIGVGNKEQPYDDSDVRQLTLLDAGHVATDPAP